jgi:hypothetical protein
LESNSSRIFIDVAERCKKHRERQADTEIGKPNREIDRYRNGQTHRETEKQAGRQIHRQIPRSDGQM